MQTCAAGWSEPGARQRPDLAPGDALVLYTDGVTDALNGEGEMFGDDRLREVITARLGCSAAATIGAICGALAAFTGGAEPADDVTVVVVRRV
jgi:sigma-B regulation protein RsbU (phosphoserine phosphatase)